MSTEQFILAAPPDEPRRLELWLQHAAGFTMIQNVREYARAEIDPELDEVAREAARRSIDDTLYGLMRVIDQIDVPLRGNELELTVHVVARLSRHTDSGEEVAAELDLNDGDGACMGFWLWVDGDFGEDPVVTHQPPAGP